MIDGKQKFHSAMSLNFIGIHLKLKNMIRIYEKESRLVENDARKM